MQLQQFQSMEVKSELQHLHARNRRELVKVNHPKQEQS